MIVVVVLMVFTTEEEVARFKWSFKAAFFTAAVATAFETFGFEPKVNKRQYNNISKKIYVVTFMLRTLRNRVLEHFFLLCSSLLPNGLCLICLFHRYTLCFRICLCLGRVDGAAKIGVRVRRLRKTRPWKPTRVTTKNGVVGTEFWKFNNVIFISKFWNIWFQNIVTFDLNKYLIYPFRQFVSRELQHRF